MFLWPMPNRPQIDKEDKATQLLNQGVVLSLSSYLGGYDLESEQQCFRFKWLNLNYICLTHELSLEDEKKSFMLMTL